MTKTKFRDIRFAPWGLLAVALIGVRQTCAGQASGGSQKTGDQVTQETVNITFNSVIEQVRKAKQTTNTAAARRALFTNLVPYILLVKSNDQGLVLANFRSQVQEWRTDVQTANPPASKGTTSVVSKGSVPYLLGLATENGALTQMTSGTSVTFRTNPTGLITALQKYGYAESGPNSYTDRTAKFVKNFSAAVTFNTGNTSNTSSVGQGSQIGTLTGSAQQISSFDVRYDIYNHRDPRDPRYSKKWLQLRTEVMPDLAARFQNFGEEVDGTSLLKPFVNAKADADSKEKAYEALKADSDAKQQAYNAAAEADKAAAKVAFDKAMEETKAAKAALDKATSESNEAKDKYENQKKKFDDWRDIRGFNAIDAAFKSASVDSVNTAALQIAQDFLDTFGQDPAVQKAAADADHAILTYLNQKSTIVNSIAKSPIVTLEYTDLLEGSITTAMASGSTQATTTSAKLPSLSNFKLIVATGTAHGITLTSNASLTIFNSIPVGTNTGRVRDFQLSGEVDVPITEIKSLGVPTVTFSGLFLSLQQQPLGMPIEVNGVPVNMKGNLGLAQAKISFPVKKGSGVRVPLSITYASRTEFNHEHDVSGQIGITFNLDSVFAAMKP